MPTPSEKKKQTQLLGGRPTLLSHSRDTFIGMRAAEMQQQAILSRLPARTMPPIMSAEPRSSSTGSLPAATSSSDLIRGIGATPKRKSTKQGLNRLMMPLNRDFQVEPLAIDMIQPLVDLAYWSNFVEVQRDAASAFAALSMNEENLFMLAQAGALGALLSLMSSSNSDPNELGDNDCVKDAALALAQLVKLKDIKVRFLSAPKGLETVFAMMHSHQKKIKRAAMGVMRNLCTTDDIDTQVIARGGLRHLFGLVHNKSDSHVQNVAAEVVRSIANSGVKKELLSDLHVLRLALMSLRAEFLDSEELIELAILEYLTAVASAQQNRALIVQLGASRVLLNKLNDQYMNIPNIVVICKCLLFLSNDPECHPQLLKENLLPILIKVAFKDVPSRLRIQLSATAAPGASPDALDGNSAEAEPPKDYSKSPAHDIMRACFTIIAEMSKTASCAEEIIHSGIVLHLTEAAFSLFGSDRKMARDLGQIIQQLAEQAKDSVQWCQTLTSHGALDATERMVLSNDLRQKSFAVRGLVVFAEHQNVRHIICSQAIIVELIALAYIPEDSAPCINLLSRISDLESARDMLVELGVLDPLLGALKANWDKSHDSFPLVADAMHALKNLNHMEKTKHAIVADTTMKLIFRISKMSNHPARSDAKKILTSLGPEAAAFAIQVTLLLFIQKVKRKKMYKIMGEHAKQSRLQTQSMTGGRRAATNISTKKQA